MRARGRLFRKYVVTIVVLVSGALVTSSAIEIYFSYQENKAALIAVQREKAIAAASKIEAFITEIEHQVGWTTQPQLIAPGAAIDQRRFDFLRLLRQVLAITEVSYLDRQGREQIRVSRLAMDVVGSQADFSGEPEFREAKKGRTYYGPVSFRKESEPYMTIAMAGSGSNAGVTVVAVNLKFIWDVVSQIKVGRAGQAYAVDGGGNLLAHPDISLVLQKTAFAGLPQVRAAISGPPRPDDRGEEIAIARDFRNHRVLTAYATIPSLRWSVFVEQPLEEAFEPLRASIQRTALLLLVGVVLSFLASLVLARRMVRPISALQVGAAKIGAGDLAERITVGTGDELEALADQFNRMASQLEESYTGLERKVDERTRELSESLEQQTATADILSVISASPTDIAPVFDAILERATALCDAHMGILGLYEDGRYRQVAERGANEEYKRWIFSDQAAAFRDPSTGVGRMIATREPVHIVDLTTEPAYRERNPARIATVEVGGARTFLAVPMLKEGRLSGGIVIYRPEVRAFSQRQIELLQIFANQAVIAIENVRLFKEIQERNAEVTEALEQRTATGEILGVISSSPTDVQPVFETIVASCKRLLGARSAVVLRLVDGELRLVAFTPTTPEADDELQRFYPRSLDANTAVATVARERVPFVVSDTETDGRIPTSSRVVARARGYRSMLIVPMLRKGDVIGTISVSRATVGSFSDKDIALLQTFADQAVIAIENVRLFTELQSRNEEVTEALEQQTATGEILRAINRAQTDVQPVFDVIATSALHLCGGLASAVLRYDGALVHLAALDSVGRLQAEPLRSQFPRPADGLIGIAVQTGAPVYSSDVMTDDRTPHKELARAVGYRSNLAVPMLRDGVVVGTIVVVHPEVDAFDDKQIALLQTFADQAVIAIENVRLFTELQERTAQLQVANRHKDEFLANMSHELRTPLNAIIGFSEVMLERMFGDVNEKQEEYLNDILSSGRHLLSLINDILDLSKIEAGRMELELTDFDLPVAIDNALTLVHERAARRGLDLASDIDPRLGRFRGDERKIKQVLLNLLSNAIKFTPEGGRVEVRAALKDDVVEIGVADTGVGIAPEDQKVVFEEFRQVGTDVTRKHEGTGLGLALARRFVELHGGNLWLESEVNVGSTFTFTLPTRR